MLLSVFCGVGGLDLGFEETGFDIGVAVDKNADSVSSYNHNRQGSGEAVGVVHDIRQVSLEWLDQRAGGEFHPIGVIGGPPCQSFSQSNRSPVDDDPRHELPFVFADLLGRLNGRSPVHFFALENVPGLCRDHAGHYEEICAAFSQAGFNISDAVMNANDYSVPQSRERLILVGFNRQVYGDRKWTPPAKIPGKKLTVKSAIGALPEPVYFRKNLVPEEIPFHRNHWCMAPKSEKFKGALKEGQTGSRSFKTLSWAAPSITVAYGHREVHVHPDCHRRLSVLEAMRLQGFPEDYELLGTLSSQIQQVSEAVPPPLARAVARSIVAQLADGLPVARLELRRQLGAVKPKNDRVPCFMRLDNVMNEHFEKASRMRWPCASYCWRASGLR